MTCAKLISVCMEVASVAQLVGGRYELIAPLGQGGMGQVWEAVDRQLERRVAVKLLSNDAVAYRSDSRELVRRFAREAELTAGLQHPGVPAVYDAGSSEYGLFLVMELVNGCTVADLIAEQGPLPVEWAAAVAAQVCSVLVVAHGRSLVHRDIKPQNLMVTRDGTVKVLDFGVATVLDAAGVVRITRTGETVGTPAYMAPEQLRSEPATSRTDLYALGCVLYEMLAGEPVFKATSPHALQYKHLNEAPRPLHRADVPSLLVDLVRRLLAKEPWQRPGDAREVYELLLVFVQGVHPLGDVNPVVSVPTGMQLHARVLVRLAGTAPESPVPPPVPPPAPPTAPPLVLPTAPPRAGYAPPTKRPSEGYAPSAVQSPAGYAPPWETRTPPQDFGWKFLHSLWMVPTLAFGFLTWLSFLYIGIRHRCRAWLIASALYGVSNVATAVLVMTTTDQNGAASTPAALLSLGLFIGGVVHAAAVNPARLRLRAHNTP